MTLDHLQASRGTSHVSCTALRHAKKTLHSHQLMDTLSLTCMTEVVPSFSKVQSSYFHIDCWFVRHRDLPLIHRVDIADICLHDHGPLSLTLKPGDLADPL